MKLEPCVCYHHFDNVVHLLQASINLLSLVELLILYSDYIFLYCSRKGDLTKYILCWQATYFSLLTCQCWSHGFYHFLQVWLGLPKLAKDHVVGTKAFIFCHNNLIKNNIRWAFVVEHLSNSLASNGLPTKHGF